MKNENEQIKIYAYFREKFSLIKKITFRGIYFYFSGIYINSSYYNQYFGQFFDCLKPNKIKASQITEFFF